MDTIQLPARKISDTVNIGYALQQRKSCRNYARKSVTLHQLANMLWAAQGVISQSFPMRRNAPSAGALFRWKFSLLSGEKARTDSIVIQWSPAL